MKSTLEFLRDTASLGSLAPSQLDFLAEHAGVESYQQGERIFEQGRPAEACYMLIDGEVALSFRSPAGPEGGQDSPGMETRLRQFDDPGRLLGWSSAMVEPHRYRASLVALVPTRLLMIERGALDRLIETDPSFGVALMERIIWVLGNRLRETRTRLVAQRYDTEIVAIQSLLDQSSEVLHVDSPLHKIPYYLRNRLTVADAFQALEIVKAHGDTHEQDLAGLCLEILQQVRKELTLYQDLQHVYETVVSAPADTPAEEIRNRCCEEFVKLYEKLDYVIQGNENLPDQPGHIFIMNHLFNHPDNTLPNRFQLTLDTHFVSSMILLRKYGDAPVPVIRQSRSDEFGHQKYYDRLGYIYVQAGQVDGSGEGIAVDPAELRRQFVDSARKCLQAGKNLVICPEGTSVATEDSPVAMKTGAFHLAAQIEPEPLIVPIAIANFDKNITRTKLAAIICKPFKLSEAVSVPIDSLELFEFVNRFRRQFAEHVRAAVRLAA